MSILQTISDKLVADLVAGGGTGWPITLSYLPDTADGASDQIVSIFEYEGGTEPHEDFFYPKIAITVRGAAHEYTAARTKIDQVITSLDASVLPGMVYMFVLRNPFDLGRDSENRPLLSISFEAMVER